MKERKDLVKKIAAERIELLFGLSESMINENQGLAHRYVETLKRISTHYKVPIPKKMKDRICAACRTLLVPGLNCRVNVVSSHKYVAYVCNRCGKEKHLHY